ncbi:MAG: riboflavin synthase [Cyclobacteriaceae bacterium]
MFTGIVESVGKVVELKKTGSNLDLRVKSSITPELQIDQSISHNGVCLTVTALEGDTYWVTAIDETLKKTNLKTLSVDGEVNLERCMKADARFDGHIVQGHVDTVATVESVEEKDGSWVFRFRLSKEGLIVEKGSICVNGISLTCFDINENMFSVAIIPYTFEHTNFNQLKATDIVNIEFDIIGKYIHQILNKRT